PGASERLLDQPPRRQRDGARLAGLRRRRKRLGAAFVADGTAGRMPGSERAEQLADNLECRRTVVADHREGLDRAVPDLRHLRRLVFGAEQRRLALGRDDDEAGTRDLDEVAADEENVLRRPDDGDVHLGGSELRLQLLDTKVPWHRLEALTQ